MVKSTQPTARRPQHAARCTRHAALSTESTVHSSQHTVNTTQHADHSIQSIACNPLHGVHSMQHAAHNPQHAARSPKTQNTPSTVRSPQHAAYSPQSAVRSTHAIASNVLSEMPCKHTFLYRNSRKFNIKQQRLVVSSLIQCNFDYTGSAWYSRLSHKIKCRMQRSDNKIVCVLVKCSC